jgi:ribosomal 30S subunit maturation factor RimM
LVLNETYSETLSEIGIAVKAYGVKGFLRILESSSLFTQVRLLSRIFEVMPEGVWQELREVAMGCS